MYPLVTLVAKPRRRLPVEYCLAWHTMTEIKEILCQKCGEKCIFLCIFLFYLATDNHIYWLGGDLTDHRFFCSFGRFALGLICRAKP